MSISPNLIESLKLGSQAIASLAALAKRGQLLFFPKEASEQQTQFIAWSPGEESRKMTAIVSSRLGRELEGKHAFFRVLRIACSQLHPKHQVLLSAKSTTTYRYLNRAADLFGLDLVELVPAKKNQSICRWLSELEQATRKGEVSPLRGCCEDLSASLIPSAGKNAVHNQRTFTDRAHEGRIFVSPAIHVLPGKSLIDKQVVELADQVLAIHIRTGGNIDRSLRERLATRNSGRIFIAVGEDELVDSATASTMMAAGAIGWYLPKSETTADQQKEPLDSMELCRSDSNSANIVELSTLENSGSLLSHCTRHAKGPWPDQAESDYLDELIMGNAVSDRSAFATIRRIVAQRKILATGNAIRGGVRMVSFTAVSLTQLHALHRYRPHRGRWDFEPYGVAIQRESLIMHGAREVIYGDEKTWTELSDDDQPFFQKVGNQKNSIDWRTEEEWRIAGNYTGDNAGELDLSSFASEDVSIFVPTHDEAKQIAAISPWRVIVMGQ